MSQDKHDDTESNDCYKGTSLHQHTNGDHILERIISETVNALDDEAVRPTPTVDFDRDVATRIIRRALLRVLSMEVEISTVVLTRMG